MSLKLALPKGWLQGHTAAFLEKAGFKYTDYTPSSRSYRPKSTGFPGLFTKVFHEKDLAIQVALGNYDVAICGLDWIEELLAKYHSDAIVKVRDLGYGRRNLYVASSKFSDLHSLEDIKARDGIIRIVTEYPNLADAFALKLQLKRFTILPVWGATEAYPPEHAELTIVSGASADEIQGKDLIPIAKILSGNAWLIANRNSLAQKNLGILLSPFHQVSPPRSDEDDRLSIDEIDATEAFESGVFPDGEVSIALADGHQQSHTSNFMKNAGIKIKGYREPPPTRRPEIAFDGISVKVVRPQDMPRQTANGNFDLAITGRDWLFDHRYQFPASPVEEVLNLGFGWVRIVAVVHDDLPVKNVAGLRNLLQSDRIPVLRIATEYTNIADKWARDNRLAPYKVIPTWGATEAFLPEDADVLIENTETGKTLKRNRLKIIETLFESTGCLIGNTKALADPAKKERLNHIIDIFKAGLQT